MAIIGRRNLLSIIRESSPGLYLDGGDLREILLPRRYIPKNLQPKAVLDVFVYRDSDDRLVATTETPKLMVGECGFLDVVSVHPQIGAFLDWGLSKDLLLPFREHSARLQPGHRVLVVVYLDPKTDRIVASTRLHRHLRADRPPYRNGQEVNLLIADQTPLGYNAIIENQYMGLLYSNNLPAPLVPGQQIKGYIKLVRPNGKIDLSLDQAGYQRVASLTDMILESLRRSGGQLNFDDNSAPLEIRQTFGVSKKAFKQALGKLYKLRKIAFTKPGIQLLDNSNWSPGS